MVDERGNEQEMNSKFVMERAKYRCKLLSHLNIA